MEEQFKALLEDTLAQVGKQIKGDVAQVSEYMVQRTAHLAEIANEPGFAEAVLAERDNVLLRAGIAATRSADVADQRIIGVITGAMRIAAVAAG